MDTAVKLSAQVIRTAERLMDQATLVYDGIRDAPCTTKPACRRPGREDTKRGRSKSARRSKSCDDRETPGRKHSEHLKRYRERSKSRTQQQRKYLLPLNDPLDSSFDPKAKSLQEAQEEAQKLVHKNLMKALSELPYSSGTVVSVEEAVEDADKVTHKMNKRVISLIRKGGMAKESEKEGAIDQVNDDDMREMPPQNIVLRHDEELLLTPIRRQSSDESEMFVGMENPSLLMPRPESEASTVKLSKVRLETGTCTPETSASSTDDSMDVGDVLESAAEMLNEFHIDEDKDDMDNSSSQEMTYDESIKLMPGLIKSTRPKRVLNRPRRTAVLGNKPTPRPRHHLSLRSFEGSIHKIQIMQSTRRTQATCPTTSLLNHRAPIRTDLDEELPSPPSMGSLE